MKTTVTTFSGDWAEVKLAALGTIHKKSFKGEVTSEWKEAMIVGRHSPIREFRIKVLIEDIPRWIADQLVRHNVGVNNYMGTMRPDRGNIPRSEQTMEDLTIFRQTYNIDSFLTMCEARLCVGAVSKETRKLVEELVHLLSKAEPEIAKYCAPPCIHQGGCKEALITEMMGKAKCTHYDYFRSRTGYIKDLSQRFEEYKNYRNGE